MGRRGISKYDGVFNIGQTFGKWTLISADVVIQHDACILCRCECNNERLVHVYNLLNGSSTCCAECGHSMKRENNPTWKGYKEIQYCWFSKYFNRNGRNKKRSGNVTIEQIYDIWVGQNKKCALSGVPIDFIRRNGIGISASIDRIDSLKEYVIDNIQLVHKDVNLMKNHFDQNYFIETCKLITTVNDQKLDTISTKY